MRAPFLLIPRARKNSNERFWYAKFWDEDSRRYCHTKALGVPCLGRRNGRDIAIKAAEALVEETARTTDPLVLDFITAFWAPTSRHVRERAIVDKRPLSLDYLDHNRRAIHLHITPFPGFRSLRLSKIRAGIVKDWQLWCIEHGTTPRACNIALQALRVPIRDAVARGDIPADPLAIVKKIPEVIKERGVLTTNEIGRLVCAHESDPRVKAGVLLATLCGLRCGEIRGLRWADIDFENELLYIRHNAVAFENDKPPKTGSKRTIPLQNAIKTVLEAVRNITQYSGKDDFVIFSTFRSGFPITGHALLNGLYRMLNTIGISEEERRRRNLNLHAMRHTFITMARNIGLPDISVMALSGHKSPDMLTRYSHVAQIIDFKDMRTKLERVVNQ